MPGPEGHYKYIYVLSTWDNGKCRVLKYSDEPYDEWVECSEIHKRHMIEAGYREMSELQTLLVPGLQEQLKSVQVTHGGGAK